MQFDKIGFVPFDWNECVIISNMINEHRDLQRIISENMFDDFAVSWSGMFLHQIYHFMKDVDWSDYEENMNSLLYAFLETQTIQLEWTMFSLYCGQYELVFRELRNMIESAFLFYRFDIIPENKYINGAEKMNQISLVSEMETFGKKVFQKSGYLNWEVTYNNVYRPLCYYTHTKISIDRVEKNYDIYNAALSPVFDDMMILKCLKYLQCIILTEIDLMKDVLSKVYGIDTGNCFDKIFNKLVIPDSFE